jgi:hypothetical protein
MYVTLLFVFFLVHIPLLEYLRLPLPTGSLRLSNRFQFFHDYSYAGIAESTDGFDSILWMATNCEKGVTLTFRAFDHLVQAGMAAI